MQLVSTITVKDIIDEDFANYYKPSMFIATSKCSFKCEHEDKNVKCQNSKIANQPNIVLNIDDVIDRFLANPITQAVVLGGLEPFDTIDELVSFIIRFKERCKNDLVIYTGYTISEVSEMQIDNMPFFNYLKKQKIVNNYMNNPLIIKYGRFKSNCDSVLDPILNVRLASSNQHARAYF